MKIYEINYSLFALIPNKEFVLDGDLTSTIKPQDEIKTPLGRYRIDKLSYDAKLDKTLVLASEK